MKGLLLVQEGEMTPKQRKKFIAMLRRCAIARECKMKELEEQYKKQILGNTKQ